jgi:hypothetical protein
VDLIHHTGDDFTNRFSTSGLSPSVDESADRLHLGGWSVGELPTVAGWLVTGLNGENLIEAPADTQSEAWQRACEQARSVGMLASARE